MALSALLLQTPVLAPDTVAAKKISSLTDSITNRITNVTPEKIHQDLQSFDGMEVINRLVDVGVTFGLRLISAILVFIVGRFIIIKIHNLLRNIMIGRDMDRSLATFLLSFFKITFFFILAIIVISIVGIETSSFIAIFASAGIAIGMAFSGTLQNFAGGVLILLLKPYKVGDYIEFDKYKGTVKEIQIFHTIITTYNNESIIIPNGSLSTGTINNYSREKFRRLEWRVSISYGADVDVARKVILDILNTDERIIKVDADAGDADATENADAEEVAPEEIKKLPWYKRLCYKQRKRNEQIAAWRNEKKREISSKMPSINFTPYVAVENLDDSAVVLIVRAWCTFEDYWNALYAINEAIYKQLPANGLEFPFPQLDVHFDKNSMS